LSSAAIKPAVAPGRRQDAARTGVASFVPGCASWSPPPNSVAFDRPVKA